ncbi:MAG: S9 family peptidase [Gemmatimonadota bacterium]|jgi:dipeptidyl aminopeptidase/acylaminoacyl peptidase|nr:S9 family peptidase [Gemmatimonadota bacterium]
MPSSFPRSIGRLLAMAWWWSAIPALVASQEPAAPSVSGRLLQLADYLEWEQVSEPRLSPDGARVVYARRVVDQLNDRWESSLWIMNADGTRNRFLVKGSGAEWSPDGTRIAYIAAGEPSGAQVFVRWMDDEGAITQVTRVTDAPGGLRWSPDGRTLAFTMRVARGPAKDNPFARVALPAAPKGAKWTEPPKVVTDLDWRQDREGATDDGVRHVFVVPADGGTARQVTNGDWDHGTPAWSPDGRTLAFSALRIPNAQLAWRESEVYAADVATGTIRQLTRRKGPDANPVWSPDGRMIAYTGFDSTDATWQDAAIYLMNADGSSPRALTKAMDRSPAGMFWSPDGSGLFFNADNEGSRHLYFVTSAGQVRQVSQGEEVLTITDLSKAGIAVGTRTTPTEPGDVVRVSLKGAPAITRLTEVNADVLAGKVLGAQEAIWYPSKDGLRVQGWIVKPPDFDPSKKYPLMLEIHGGPHAMYNVGWSFARQEHAANGFVVLYTNPRGSTGYGSAFGNAIKNAYPGKDFDDLMAGVDQVLGRGYVDPARLYVFGCSGGGVLTSWIVGHTDRFAAASANCPVTNWMSFVGTTDGPQFWYRNFEKNFWDDPSEHLRRSPIMYVGKVTTPTMLMTGVLDLRTPMPQTEEYYSALKMRGVPSAMVRFNNEWHGTSSTPSNFLRTQAYLREWFGKYTRGSKPAT